MSCIPTVKTCRPELFHCLCLAPVLLLSLALGTGCDETVVGDQLASLASAGTQPTESNAVEFAKSALAESEVQLAGLLEEPIQGSVQGPPPPPPPPHPCVIAAIEMSHACAQQTQATAAGCIENIRHLFAQGEFEAAHQAAFACIEEINQHTEACLAALRQHCEQCVRDLIEHEAPVELIEAVIRACYRAAEHILHARRAAIAAIDDEVDRGDAFNCAAWVRRTAQECAERNRQIADGCVPAIEELVAQGLIEEARQQARECIGQIRVNSADCARAIFDRSQQCLARLIRNCADEWLIFMVHEATEDSLGMVGRSARESVMRILQVLPPPEGGGRESGDVGLQE